MTQLWILLRKGGLHREVVSSTWAFNRVVSLRCSQMGKWLIIRCLLLLQEVIKVVKNARRTFQVMGLGVMALGPPALQVQVASVLDLEMILEVHPRRKIYYLQTIV